MVLSPEVEDRVAHAIANKPKTASRSASPESPDPATEDQIARELAIICDVALAKLQTGNTIEAAAPANNP
jgi:hypothetical protein